MRVLAAGGLACLVIIGGSASPAIADSAGQSREAVVAQYQSVLLPATDVPNDWTGSVDGCKAGTTGPAFQAATLTAINYVRGLVSLSAVSLDPAKSAPAQAASLVMLAQRDLDHRPPSSWPCWTQQAYDGASHSNLYLGRTGADAIVGYMVDPGPDNWSAGHRRWILDSRAVTVGTGDTSGSNALLVIGAPYASAPPHWTPWPTAGYFPWQLEPSGRWSLSMPGADFAGASVTASAAGTPLAVTMHPVRNGYGDNTLTWEVALPAPEPSRHPVDLNVDVRVTGAWSAGVPVDYAYTVSLVDAAPHTAPSAPYDLALARNAGGILASWRPSEDTGGETVTYTVTAVPTGRGSAGLRARTCTTTASACQLTRTVRKVTYRVSVSARNTVGSSDKDTGVSYGARR